MAVCVAPTATAQTAQRIWELNGSYAETNGGSALVPNGGTLGATGYTFAAGQGPSASNALANVAEYSIEMIFSINDVSSYRSLLNFNNLTNDNAIYCMAGSLVFYGSSGGNSTTVNFIAGQSHRLVLTRNASTKVTTAYVDAVQVGQTTDTANNYVASGPNGIIHFLRDNGGEHPSGFLDRIRIFDTVLTSAQVATLGNNAPTGIVLSNTTLAENSPANSTVGTFSTSDPDAGNTFTYTFASGGADNAGFTISGNTLRMIAAPDYETKSLYSIRIRSTDGGGLFVEQAFVVAISNVNEPPSFTKGPNVDHPIGSTAVRTVTGWATNIDDGDSTVTQALTFNVAVTSGSGMFSVPPSVSSAGTLTYTPNGTTGTATVTVSLTDDATAGGAALTSPTQSFTITAIAPPEINVTGNSTSIPSGDKAPSLADHTHFGAVSASLARSFTIQNTGVGVLNIASITVTGDPSPEFVVSGAPGTVAAGASATFTVTYTPTLGLPVSRALITINNNDIDEGAYVFAVEGERAYNFTSPVWTGRAASEATTWNAVTFGQGRFVAVADTGTNRVMTSTDGINWTGRSAPLSPWKAVTYGNGLFVAVADSGSSNVMTSPDGITWTARTPATFTPFTSVTYGDGLFVAVGANTTNVGTSTDGITWTIRTGPQANSWRSVTYGRGLFVAVAASGTNRVMTSPDGINWTARTASDAYSWASVTYGNGLFVSVAMTSGGIADAKLIMSSPDGITWTGVTTPSPATWRTVSYGNGRFVAVADSGTNRVMTSTDGASWTAGNAAQANPWSGLTYGQGRFAAVATLGVQQVMTYGPVLAEINITGNGLTIVSGDKSPATADFTRFGSVGTSLTRTFSITNSGIDTLAISSITVSGEHASEFAVSGAPSSIAIGGTANFSVTYTPTLGVPTSRATITVNNNDNDEGTYQFVVEGEKAFAATSTGWISKAAAVQNQWRSVAFGNGLFVALADSLGSQVMTSPNGLVWTSRTIDFGGWNSVAYGNGQFVAVSSAGTNQIATSPDGVVWTSRPAPEANGWYSVAYGDGLFVAIAYNGTNRLMTSPDGVTWTLRSVPANTWRSVAYGNGRFVAVSSDGTNRVLHSTDGITWTGASAAEANLWIGVTYGNGLFVAVAASGTNRVMTSPDGINWTARAATEPSVWLSVAYGNGQFVAVANSGTNRVMTSPDGFTWTVRSASEANAWYGVGYGNGRFVAVAYDGTNRVMVALPSAPEIQVSGGGVAIADGTRLISSVNSTQFGIVTTSLARTFRIDNEGAVALAISSITVSGEQSADFAVSGVPASIAAGDSATFTVTFNPVSGASLSRALVTVNSNDADEAAYDFAIEGEKGYSFTGASWSVRPPAEANTWISVTYGNGLYVAVAINGTNRVMTSPDGLTWTPRAAAAANQWWSVTYGQGLFVAVSVGGTNQVMTSPDGITWTSRPFSLTLGFTSVTYGNGLFVGVGTNGVATSPDGITWTARTSTEANQWTSVTYGNGLYVAVSTSGTNRVMTSPDGITWTARAAAAANPWNSVTYGRGLFVAVASSGTQRVMTSPDGVTWTARTAAELTTYYSVAYGGGLFMAVANSGFNQTMTSTDGITWTAVPSASASAWAAVGYGAGRFVSVATTGTDRVMVYKAPVPEIRLLGNGAPILDGDKVPTFAKLSRFGTVDGSLARTFTVENSGTDPLTISSISVSGDHAAEFAVSGAPSSVVAGSTATFTVTYTPSLGVGTSRATITVASNDYDEGTYDFVVEGEMAQLAAGAVWTARSAAEANSWRSVTYGNGQFLAVAATGTNRLMTSSDGVAWTARSISPALPFRSVVYGQGRFVAVASDTAITTSSTDGITWTGAGSTEASGWSSVAYGDGLFVAVAISGTTRVMTSPDGIAWTARSAPGANSWSSVAYGNGVFVAVSLGGANPVMTSPDGVTWTLRSVPEANTWTSVAYGNGQFVAVSTNGTNRVMTSGDGITWTARTAAAASTWGYVTYGNGQFVAVADSGATRVMTSTDGINWTARSSPEANTWTSVAYGAGRFVAVSSDGTNRVMTSTPPPEIEVLGNGGVIPDGTVAVSEARHTRFGPVAVQRARTFTISNTGSGELAIASITISGESASEFYISAAPSLIAAGGTSSFNVNYFPTSGAPTSRARVTITNNDPDESSYDFVVEGEKAYAAVGAQWSSQATTGSTVWRRVTYGKGLFVAVGDTAAPWIMTSPDGITWTARTPPAAANWSAVTYGNGQFVAVAFNSANIATSADGITWTARTAPSASGWASVTYGDGVYVAVASTGTHRVMRSADGVTWTAQTPSEVKSWIDVVHGNGLFVAIANSGTPNDAMTSPDGITWTGCDGAGSVIAYGNGTFVSVAALSGLVRTSPDGVTWTAGASLAPNLWTNIAYGNGLFVAVSSSGTNRIATSPDGITWTARTAPAANTWFGVAYGAGKFVAVSGNGTNRAMLSIPTTSAQVENWAVLQGMTGDLALPTAEPYGDGVPNLLKYAFNMPLDGPRSNTLNPAAGVGASGMPVYTPNLSGPNPTFRAQFLRRRNSGLSYVPQRASSLGGAFTPMLATPVVTVIDADWELVTVDEPLGLPLPASFFSRVEVTAP